MEWVWFQREFPWLGRGFIHAVADDHAVAFIHELEERGFVVSELRALIGANFSVELYRSLGITDHEPVALSWDAVHDHFRDLVLPPRFALMWRLADKFASRETKVFAEASAILSQEFEDLGANGVQAVLVLTGTGTSFASPSRPDR